MLSFDPLIAPQRGHLFAWLPVMLATGAGMYFALPVEPPPWAPGALAVGVLALMLGARRVHESTAPLLVAVALVLAGLAMTQWRAQSVAAPVLSFRYYGPVEGRIVDIDRSLSDKLRLTLDEVVLTDTPPARTPYRVRLSLHGQQGFFAPEPGQRIILTGHLSPPMGPAEPGGFDFRRMAWFERLGAVGYTRNPVLLLEPPRHDSAALRLTRFRMTLADAVRDRLPGQPGAFAAAVVTGDRSGLSRDTLDAMRASNLAHLLAISGLHMGLLTGFIFFVVRLGLALVPWVALRTDGRKWAAVVALVVATCYLGLSGGSVATQRAYIMAAVILGAVMLDRRALTLRAVALAATIILVWRPESLTGAGFQMSFAATTALVFVFGQIRDSGMRKGPRWLRPVLALVTSSAVAGFATAPIGAAQFNQIAQFGLIANLLAVPMMGMVVMPAAVLAACLAPLGLSQAGLWIMGLGCRWILWVADWVSGLDAALIRVVSPSPYVIVLLVLGALWVILWQGRGRWLGLPVAMAALILWGQTDRPPVLIAASGKLIGVLGPEGRVLNKPRGDGFAARAWLENDGDGRDQKTAAQPGKTGFDAEVAGLRLRILTAKQLKGSPAPCAGTDVLILPKPLDLPCPVLTPESLRRTGSLALWPGEDGVRIVTASERAGHRLWSTPVVRLSLEAPAPQIAAAD